MVFRKFGFHIEQIRLRFSWCKCREIDVLIEKLNGVFATFSEPNISIFCGRRSHTILPFFYKEWCRNSSETGTLGTFFRFDAFYDRLGSSLFTLEDSTEGGRLVDALSAAGAPRTYPVTKSSPRREMCDTKFEPATFRPRPL